MIWNIRNMHKECELLIQDHGGDMPIVIQIGAVHYEVKGVQLSDSSRDGLIKLVLHPGAPVGDASTNVGCDMEGYAE